MEKINEFIAKANLTLYKNIEKLEELEKEKLQLLSDFNNADSNRQQELLKQMQQSENKYQKLFEEVLEIHTKIKKAKRQMS